MGNIDILEMWIYRGIFKIMYIDYVTNKEVMKEQTIFLQIHTNVNMPVFRPRAESSKI